MTEKIKNAIEKVQKYYEKKIKPVVDKVRDYVNGHKKTVAIVTSVCLIAAAATILTCLSIYDNGKSKKGETDESGWGSGITENLPCFSEEADSLKLTDEYAAAYYSGVKGEQVDEYIALLTEECGVKFEGNKYPRSAVFGDRIITIHYNVTEMHFSVTVNLREN